MCGIIAVLRRPSDRTPPAPDWVVEMAGGATAALATPGPAAGAATRAAEALEALNAALGGGPGVMTLLRHPDLAGRLEEQLGSVDEWISTQEAALDGPGAPVGGALEDINAALVRLKDASWAISRDRLRVAASVAGLLGAETEVTAEAVDAFLNIEVALSALDRLEVRGRDSAGLHVMVEGHGLELTGADAHHLAGRDDPLFGSLAARDAQGCLSLVYKAAAEIGELGDNVRALRAGIAGDPLLHLALRHPGARATVLAHTRWASVGLISQANAHPLNQEEAGPSGPSGPYVVAALNGDVDNYADLSAAADLSFPPEFTTDAKIIPALVARRTAEGAGVTEAFRETVASFHGSVAIGAHAAGEPDRLFLALKGSGQALYVGLAEDAFVVASEPYGLVEQTPRYLRMDGETTGGQIVVLDRAGAGTLDGIARYGYDGAALPVGEDELTTAEITTRDIDRRGYPHYLLKEISEAPASLAKTLRGKVLPTADGLLEVRLGDDALPDAVRRRLAGGTTRRILVIGQGTAAVAGHSVAAALRSFLAAAPITVTAVTATELSGFGLTDDMSDTLVVAISQSGTTTDTNRTIDLVRGRGAAVLAIVNRRNSHLVEKSDGVLYTSDGRDVEMAVPSTKAFYAQVAAGFLLALAVAEAAGVGNREVASAILTGLRALPGAMEQVLAGRDDIAALAHRHAPARRYWAVVGNGPNRVAAEEVRIKLSELCYKSIACDVTEDKKHIDLASEPLILVCASGLVGANADDVAKEIAIYRAHKALPIVIAGEAATVLHLPGHTIIVPDVEPEVAFVLSAMAGHLFGYEAALSIDAQALPLRQARAAIEAVAPALAAGHDPLPELVPVLMPLARAFLDGVRTGAYNGHLEASTALRLGSLLSYVTGHLPVEGYEADYGLPAAPGTLLAELTGALSTAIEELTRPIDAIKHQAKTVTVGISRSEEALFSTPLVADVLAAGARRDRLSYGVLRTLAALDPAVAEVLGYTRYRIEGDVAGGTATIHVVDKGGVATGIASRTERQPALRGNKHRAAKEKAVIATVGREDGRPVLLVPEVKDQEVVGLTLLHIAFAGQLPASVARSVLIGYRRDRYAALVDTVTETEPVFDESRLGDVAGVDLLLEPVVQLADRWRRT